MPEITHLSFSSVNTFLLCGESWRRRYVVNEQAPISDNLVLGSAFHDAVESYLRGAPDLEDAFEQSWSQQLERGQTIAWESGDAGATHNIGLRMVRAKSVKPMLDQVRQNFDPEHGLIERRVKLHVPGVPVPIIGYIDCIGRDGVPCDFKTAARMWPDGKAEEDLQSLVYLAALNQEGILVPDFMFRFFVFTKGQNPTAKMFETKRKPAEVFMLFKIIRQTWEAIDAQSYPMRTDSWKCSPKYCEYWPTCRAKYV